MVIVAVVIAAVLIASATITIILLQAPSESKERLNVAFTAGPHVDEDTGEIYMYSGVSWFFDVVVTDEEGKGIGGAHVALSSGNGGRFYPSAGQTQTTGNEGHFSSIYRAPVVTEKEQVVITAHASKEGFNDGEGEITLFVHPLDGGPRTMSIVIGKSADGKNWTLTITDVPPLQHTMFTYLTIYSPGGSPVPECFAVALDSLDYGMNGAEFTGTGIYVEPGDQILISAVIYDVGYTYEIADSSGRLAAGELKI